MPGGMHMHRLQCGSSVLKVVVLSREARAHSTPGGIGRATGFRYVTIKVDDIAAALATCAAAGVNVPIPVTDLRPGVQIAMIEDPDGNWVELLASS
jgi:predicted enzyme related to lactoylglutathione lyase